MADLLHLAPIPVLYPQCPSSQARPPFSAPEALQAWLGPRSSEELRHLSQDMLPVDILSNYPGINSLSSFLTQKPHKVQLLFWRNLPSGYAQALKPGLIGTLHKILTPS